MESLEKRADYYVATKYLKVIRQSDLPKLTQEELKEIETREKYFYEMLEFYWSLEKPGLKLDLELNIISKNKYEATLKAYEELPKLIKQLFDMFKKGEIIFDAVEYMRSLVRSFNSVNLLSDFKKMIYWVT